MFRILQKKIVVSLQYYRYCHQLSNGTLKIQELSNRGALKVKGPEAQSFLQGLITNDIAHLKDSTSSMYTMFLNTKGRVLADSIIYRAPEEHTYLIEIDSLLVPILEKHLSTYILRKKLEITNLELILRLWVLFDTQSPKRTEVHPKIKEILARKNSRSNTDQDVLYIYKDPRSWRLGARLLASTDLKVDTIQDKLNICNDIDETDSPHQLLRYKLGIGEGSLELPPGKCFPLEANCDYLHGISFQKGCYLGQELTARTYHTGVIRKRLMPLIFNENTENKLGNDETIYIRDNKTNVGKLRGACEKYGLGLLRIDNALKHNDFTIGECQAKTERPSWWPLEASKVAAKEAKSGDVIENENRSTETVGETKTSQTDEVAKDAVTRTS
ncbi:putative transferase CAF17 homolog, mitochondrial [Chrysoperla carnea]|uniref:putative transferase CAF17 homolog, mitochondrial n=1 Tax=Chrysoperla carnea TaxID=189513 RepID=UPI001D08E990|nr:putative transferase CAF17 homolog, mitochondrial [Chrysoperla carnea]